MKPSPRAVARSSPIANSHSLATDEDEEDMDQAFNEYGGGMVPRDSVDTGYSSAINYGMNINNSGGGYDNGGGSSGPSPGELDRTSLSLPELDSPDEGSM